MKFLAFLIALTLVGSDGFAQQPRADLVILGGTVWSGTSKEPITADIAVAGNKIAAIGEQTSIKKWIGAETKIIDAKGKLVLPGFNDSHVHFMAIGNTFSTLDLSGISSADELYSRFRYHAQFVPKGRWILGSGGTDALWRDVSASGLDSSSPDNPVFLYHADAGSALTNSNALKLARSNSTVAGVVRGREFEIVRRAVPPDHSRNWAEIAETASNYAASLGVTSVQDMHSDAMADVYRKLDGEGRLKTRVYDCFSLPEQVRTKAVFIKSEPEAMVRTGCLKGFHDGDDEWTPKLRSDIMAADKAGWQVAIHAIGEKPNRIALDIFEEAVKLNGRRDRRFRLEHAEGVSDADLARLGKLGVIASIQPYLFGDGHGYLNGYYARILQTGGRLAIGSDAPMTSFDPLLGLSRELRNDAGLSLADSLAGYSTGSAFAEFAEKKKGTLSLGKLADIVILSQNIFVSYIRPADSVKVDFTIVNGEIVFERRGKSK
ncbi:amidohydrolase [soil metagenome]